MRASAAGGGFGRRSRLAHGCPAKPQAPRLEAATDAASSSAAAACRCGSHCGPAGRGQHLPRRDGGRRALIVAGLLKLGGYTRFVQLAAATPVLGESTYRAYLDGATWLTSSSAASENGDRIDRRSGADREPKGSNDTEK